MATPWSSSIFALRPSVCFRESLWNPTIGIVCQPKKGLYLHIRAFVSWGAQQIHQKLRQRTKDTIRKKMFLTVRSCICVSVRRLKKSQPKAVIDSYYLPLYFCPSSSIAFSSRQIIDSFPPICFVFLYLD